jgi:hypothetical protein
MPKYPNQIDNICKFYFQIIPIFSYMQFTREFFYSTGLTRRKISDSMKLHLGVKFSIHVISNIAGFLKAASLTLQS